jgi:hypothetical protein
MPPDSTLPPASTPLPATEPSPANPTPAPAAAAAPTSRSRRPIWIAAVVAILMIAGVATYLVRSGAHQPKSLEELTALFFDVPAAIDQSPGVTFPAEPSVGLLWGVNRLWSLADNTGGSTTLMQYQTPDQAMADFNIQSHPDQVRASVKSINGLDNALVVIVPSKYGGQLVTCIGVKGAITVTVYAQSVPEPDVEKIFIGQLNRLP